MTQSAGRRDGDDLLLTLRVQPRASKDELLLHGGGLKARVTAPPVDGKANEHLVKFLAKAFGVAKAQVELVRGETGREKQFRIHCPAQIPEVVEQALSERD